jgi:predicted amidohydrolase
MSSIDRYYAAACQLDLPNPADRKGIETRVDRMLTMVDYAVIGYRPLFDVRLVVFPEFGHAAPIYTTVDKLIERLAISVPNEHTDRYHRKCRELDIYIQTGTFLETDPKWPGHVFNTTCLIGPEGILSTYRKVHPWIPWELHTSPHDLADYDRPLFPVVETPIGKLGAAICYDWLFPEAIRQLALGGAEVLIRVSAYMDPWGTAPPMDWWTIVNRVRALENMAYVVAANQAARLEHYPPFSWPGGSMIVDFDGRILAQADPGPVEKIVVGPIDLLAVREARQRRAGHQLLGHLRTEAYPLYRQPIYARGKGHGEDTNRKNAQR